MEALRSVPELQQVLLEEMDAAGIARGVVVGRNSPTLGVIPNDDVVVGGRQLTPAPFMAYMDIGKPSIWGSWGTLRFLGDRNPRWDALIEATRP